MDSPVAGGAKSARAAEASGAGTPGMKGGSLTRMGAAVDPREEEELFALNDEPRRCFRAEVAVSDKPGRSKGRGGTVIRGSMVPM